MGEAELGELIDRFFRWGKDGHPARPDDVETRLRYVKAWLEEQLVPFRTTAIGVMARIEVVLVELEAALAPTERPRLFARIDSSFLTKSADSILDKMRRGWTDLTKAPERGFENVLQETPDLARFRIVANFQSDADRIARALETAYSDPRAALTRGQTELHREFLLKSNQFEDTVLVRPGTRKSGSRYRKGVFYPRSPVLAQHKVEVQVMTILQEAWDKKDHFLIYETRRRGEAVELEDEAEMFAMSEQLYVADLTFDRIKTKICARRAGHGKGGGDAAP